MPLKPITSDETEWAKRLPSQRSRQFRHSRGYVRQALSELWRIPPLSIPLNAPPGKPPVLAKGWGHISFSHCCDALLIGWSQQKLGVDLERRDRTFAAYKLVERYFSQEEKIALQDLNEEEFHAAVIQKWVIKEAAIKWQRGNLADDFKQWTYCKDPNLLYHKSNNQTINIQPVLFRSWCMAIAYKKNSQIHKPIICLESIVGG